MQSVEQQDAGYHVPYSFERGTRIAVIAIYPVLHVAAVWLGLFLSSGAQTATLWTSNALLLAVMVILGIRWWAPLLVSLVAAEAFSLVFLTTNLPLSVGLFYSAANMLEALVAALIWRSLVKGPISVFRLRDCILLVSVVAISAPAIGGLIAAFGQVGVGDAAAFFSFWQLWLTANALGILIITTAILGWAGASRSSLRILGARRYELALLVVLVFGLTLLVFGSSPTGVSNVLGLPYVLYPLLIWGALRFGTPVSSALVLVIAMIGIISTDLGSGPYAIQSYTEYQRVLSLQMFLVAAAISTLILGAVFSERRTALRILEESQNKFSKAFHASPDAICICRASDGRVMDVNTGFTTVTGHSREEAMGATLAQLNLLPLEEQRSKYHGQATTNGKVVKTRSIVPTRSGSAIECETAFDFVVIEGELCTIFVLHDLTRIREEEEKRLVLEAKLMQSRKMEAIGQLSAGIAHDFNNILFAILGNTELAEGRAAKLNDSDLANYLGEIREGGTRARELVAQLLTFGRNKPANPVHVNVSEVVDEVLRLLRQLLPSSLQIAATVRTEEVSVIADPVQLQQLIMNLCVNARDATKGSGAVEITVDAVSAFRGRCSSCQKRFEGDFACLSVCDSGPGIDAESLAKIFEPFYTSKDVDEGTGLGLSVVHGVVHGHNGHIVVDGSPGMTTISNYFPLAPPEDSKPTFAWVESPKTTENYLHGKVLVVDDEDSVRKVMVRILEYRGLDVTAAASAAEALHEFEEDPQSFDLVITDQTMPMMTGASLARKMLATRPDLPVILCSGFSRDINEQRAREMGIRGYYQKPLDFPTLMAQIAVLLEE